MLGPRFVTLLVAAFVAALAFTASPGESRGGTLDRALLGAEFADVLAEIDTRQYDDVGVLPFKVKKGKRPAGYSAAPLCQDMPRRVENALIMSMKVAHKQFAPVGIIRDAAGTAMEGKVGAYTKDRRAFDRLFTQPYQIAWGGAVKKNKVKAFLHGTVLSTGDRRTTRLKLELFDKDCWKNNRIEPQKAWTIPVRTDRPLLADLGYAVSLSRSAFNDAKVTTKDRDEAAAKQVTEEDEEDRPPAKAAPKEGLVSAAHNPADIGGFRFELLYDGKPVELTAREGGAGAGQPEYDAPPAPPGAKISMQMARKKNDDDSLKGLVITVNGVSTLHEDSGDVLRMKKWTVAPTERGKRLLPWEGFYVGAKAEQLKPFKVLTPKESAERAAEYGAQAGWIRVHVFVSKTGAKGAAKPAPPKPVPPAEKEEYDSANMFSTRSLPPGRFVSFDQLRGRLMAANKIKEKENSKKPRVLMRNGGLIVPEVEALPSDPLEQTEFPYPELIATLAIRYYTPEGRKAEKKNDD